MSAEPGVETVRLHARPFDGPRAALFPLIEAAGDSRLVLIGEASHGTHEFYENRAALTRELIVRRGFNLVAVEADWPDAYRVNRWVRHASHEADASSALGRERLERAIGVIYRPDTERASHYFRARLPDQFDVVLHIDETSALEPLERWAHQEADLPETYPTGI